MSKGLVVASYLLFLFVLVFGTEPYFGPTCAFFGFAVFFVRSLLLFGVSACVVFFYGFWFVFVIFLILVVILGLSVLDCSVLMLLILLHVLAARLSVGVFGLPFEGNPPGGAHGYGQLGGVNIFFGFSHRGVWMKTGAGP